MKPKFTEEERKLIGRRIRDSRNAEKYTLEQLAEIIGCSPKHLGDVERGTVSASWPLAVKIGKALILKDCDMEGRMAIRDTARRIAEYGKRLQAKKQ